MKKRFLFLSLLLCLALIVPLALAEAVYIPGERTRALIAEALNAGQVVGGQLRASIVLPDELLPDADDAEGQAQFDALMEFLNGIRFAGGVGRLDNGYRLELGGSYTAPTDENVYVTFALNVTDEGISAETNLLEGELVSIKWETLLQMLGLSDAEIQQALALRDTDWESVADELADELNALAERIGQLIEPYLATLADFAATLDIQQRSDVAAESGYPAVDQELSITCTAQDFARLIRALADQMEKDPEMLPYIEQLVTTANFTVTDGDGEETLVTTTEQFFVEMRKFADALAEENASIGFLTGYTDDGRTLYLTLALSDGSDVGALLFQIVPGETEDTRVFTFTALESDGDSVDTLLDASLTLTTNPDDENVYTAALNIQTDVSSIDFTVDSAAMTTEEGLPGYVTSYNACIPVQVSDDDTLRFDYAGEGTNSLTALDGEQSTFTMNADVYENDALVSNTKTDSTLIIEPGDGALSGRLDLTEIVTVSDELAPVTLGLNIDFSSWDYDAAETAALQETAFETATGEELTALQNRFSISFQQKMLMFNALVPDAIWDFLN